jgi:hypothetical protein
MFKSIDTAGRISSKVARCKSHGVGGPDAPALMSACEWSTLGSSFSGTIRIYHHQPGLFRRIRTPRRSLQSWMTLFVTIACASQGHDSKKDL